MCRLPRQARESLDPACCSLEFFTKLPELVGGGHGLLVHRGCRLPRQYPRELSHDGPRATADCARGLGVVTTRLALDVGVGDVVPTIPVVRVATLKSPYHLVVPELVQADSALPEVRVHDGDAWSLGSDSPLAIQGRLSRSVW